MFENTIFPALSLCFKYVAVSLESTPIFFSANPFTISVFDDENYKTATYLKIENTTTGTNVVSVTETRYGFINNMLELANGSFAVSYSLDDWANFILSGEYPLTIGGGIGQSRLCMLLLQKAHIGEVQVSLWPDEMVEVCHKAGIRLL